MKIVADVVRQFSVRLMLVAIMVLALQASQSSAYASGEKGDCLNDVHLARTTDRAGDAPSFEQAGVAQAPKAPCTSTCCNVTCSMAAFVLPVTVVPPESLSGTRHASVFHGVEGTDLDDLLRPPRTSPPV